MARTLTQAGPDRQNRLIFTGAVALAAVAAVLVFVALANFGGSDKSSPSTAGSSSIVIASRDIGAGMQITSDMLETTSLPAKAVVAGALSDKSTAVGTTARSAIAKGEQVTDVKLGQTAKDRTFSDVVPQGKRAVAVEVDEKSNVGGLAVAGDRVDVVVIGKKKTADANDASKDLPVAYIALQNIEVLSVSDTALKPTTNTTIDGSPVDATGATGNTAARPTDPKAAQSARTVTLLVDPNQAAGLALASNSYKVYLVLRPNGDNGTVNNPNDLIQLPTAN